MRYIEIDATAVARYEFGNLNQLIRHLDAGNILNVGSWW